MNQPSLWPEYQCAACCGEGRFVKSWDPEAVQRIDPYKITRFPRYSDCARCSGTGRHPLPMTEVLA